LFAAIRPALERFRGLSRESVIQASFLKRFCAFGGFVGAPDRKDISIQV
jgi:hypothetical protein